MRVWRLSGDHPLTLHTATDAVSGCGDPRRATVEGWLGEIEGVDPTLQCLRAERADALRLTRITRQVDLGMPAVGAAQ
jgi:hypothetical protein